MGWGPQYTLPEDNFATTSTKVLAMWVVAMMTGDG